MASGKPITALMSRHIEGLCRKHGIRWRQDCPRSSKSWAVVDRPNEILEIHTPPIRSAVAYASALHEIGHLLGHHQGSWRLMVREIWAWRWAQAHAMVWTPAMDRIRQDALAWYAPRAARHDAKEQAERQKETAV